MRRRSLKRLAADLERASSDAARAVAHYQLGVFHDNNGRVAEAIPQYREAIALGLPAHLAAAAHAWLASSLQKTGSMEEALEHAAQARSLDLSGRLTLFLERLEQRIRG